eukprot:m51a1_g5316 hypothetical protein (190) ;mRNA; r:304265-304998
MGNCFGGSSSKKSKAAPKRSNAPEKQPRQQSPPQRSNDQQQQPQKQQQQPSHFNDNDELAREADGIRAAARKLRDEAHKTNDKAARDALFTRANDEDKKASQLILERLNKNSPEGTVDLHLQFVADAVRIAQESLERARKRGTKQLVLIVGKGNHSKGGKALVQPAIVEWAQKAGLKYELAEGRVLVNL